MILENARMKVEIAAMGAELMSIFDKQNNRELLFDGDPAYWKRRAPILFPNVGKTFKNTVLINGKSFPTGQHGFARDSLFTLERQSEGCAVYLLESSEDSLAKYPFHFELRIIYALEESALKVTWTVKNTSEIPMSFTIGGHPAFCMDANDKKDGYALEFPGKTQLEYVLIDPACAAVNVDDVHPLTLEDSRLPLTDALFLNDALIFDNCQIEEVWLLNKDGSRRVGMACAGFPNYGIWSVQGAPFVCLEPWMGRADNRGFDAELETKPNVNRLAPGEFFEKAHKVLLP